MTLETGGWEHVSALFGRPEIDRLSSLLPDPQDPSPGHRLTDTPALDWWLRSSSLNSLVSERLGRPARPVRAILFDKTKSLNWVLAWHQDRTIAVAERHDVPGYGPWSIKAGTIHVEPPFALIERMVTARIHLDPVDRDNGPLLVAEGSHRLGKIAEADIERVVSASAVQECHAGQGDAWLYATAILHSSGPNRSGRRRRVLHVDFSGDELPNPLRWRGIGQA
ncbi:phytanoyl-CoA dioxygenase family protein [Sphingomonas jaspsi]|uniref:phytanoyl-CoA dioxygenase family protein n=1 Tax=Sphingomonas jaspsi TaxID=392409 RepID=UPI000A077B43|nr:phytanoyl-CoA dioxygenase family protein [Sphingomonas jaspsi]